MHTNKEVLSVALFLFKKHHTLLVECLKTEGAPCLAGAGGAAEGSAADGPPAPAAPDRPAAPPAAPRAAGPATGTATATGTGSSAATGSGADCSHYCGQHSSIGKEGRAQCL